MERNTTEVDGSATRLQRNGIEIHLSPLSLHISFGTYGRIVGSVEFSHIPILHMAPVWTVPHLPLFFMGVPSIRMTITLLPIFPPSFHLHRFGPRHLTSTAPQIVSVSGFLFSPIYSVASGGFGNLFLATLCWGKEDWPTGSGREGSTERFYQMGGRSDFRKTAGFPSLVFWAPGKGDQRVAKRGLAWAGWCDESAAEAAVFLKLWLLLARYPGGVEIDTGSVDGFRCSRSDAWMGVGGCG